VRFEGGSYTLQDYPPIIPSTAYDILTLPTFIRHPVILRLVQQQLGHPSVSTTSVYSGIVNKDLDEDLERLD